MAWEYYKCLHISVRWPTYVHACLKKYYHLRQKIKPPEYFQTVRVIKMKRLNKHILVGSNHKRLAFTIALER